MQVLNALHAIFTFLAAALTCTLLFVQDRNAPHYIKIYEPEQYAVSLTQMPPESGSRRYRWLYMRYAVLAVCDAQFTSNRQTA